MKPCLLVSAAVLSAVLSVGASAQQQNHQEHHPGGNHEPKTLELMHGY
jgi:hypothetical protein